MTIICIWVICHNYIFLLIQHLLFLELIMSSFVLLILKNISQTQPKFLQNPKTLNIIKHTRQSIIYSCFSLPLVLSPSCSSLSYILCRIPCSQILNIVFDYLFLVALGLLLTVCRLSLVAESGGHSLVAVHGLLTAVASLVEHGL